MIFRHALVALAITGLAVTAHAQSPSPAPSTAPGQSTPSTKANMATPQAADASKLMGRSVKNPDGDTIGKIESVYIDAGGKVDSVIVGVGGFLGVGERYAQLKWSDLQIADNGEKVAVNMSKDQLKAMAPYKYKDDAMRGKVFTDKGVWSADKRAADKAPETKTDRSMAATTPPPAASTAPSTTTPPAATASTESTGDFNIQGDVSANAVVGAKLKNDNKDTVGTVQDLYLDGSGTIKTVVVAVGGFLGVGAKDVAVKWSDLKQSRDGKSLVLTTGLSKDDLKAMPDYKYERQQPAKDQAQLPSPSRK